MQGRVATRFRGTYGTSATNFCGEAMVTTNFNVKLPWIGEGDSMWTPAPGGEVLRERVTRAVIREAGVGWDAVLTIENRHGDLPPYDLTIQSPAMRGQAEGPRWSVEVVDVAVQIDEETCVLRGRWTDYYNGEAYTYSWRAELERVEPTALVRRL